MLTNPRIGQPRLGWLSLDGRRDIARKQELESKIKSGRASEIEQYVNKSSHRLA